MNAKAIILLIVVAAFSITGFEIVHLKTQLAQSRSETISEKVAHQTDLNVIASSAKAASEAARSEEQRRQKINGEILNEANRQTKIAADYAAAANSSSVRLRDKVAGLLAAAADTSRSAGNTGTTATVSTAEANSRMFADLLSRVDQRAGKLAEIADANRIAGASCEAAYDSLSNP